MEDHHCILHLENPQLDRAAADGDLEQCQALLNEWKQRLSPAPITAQHLRSTLNKAVKANHPEVASYLLKQGAVVSDLILVFALHQTTENTISLVQTFLDNGWDINSKTDLGMVMLSLVISNEKLVRWFLSHGADPNPILPSSRQVTHPKIANPGSGILCIADACSTPTIADLLISNGTRLADSDALHAAAGEKENRPGQAEMMAHLLSLGYDVNAMGRRDYPPRRRIGRGTPLHAAVRTQQADRIQFLLQRGASLEIKNTLDQTPLEYPVAKGLATSETVLRRAEEAAARGSKLPPTLNTAN